MGWLSLAGAIITLLTEVFSGDRLKNAQELKNVKAELASRRKQAQAAADATGLGSDRDALADSVRDRDL